MIKLKQSLLALALAAVSVSSFAGTATANFQSTATVSSSCSISATNVAFGTVTPAATGSATATGTITSRCSNAVAYTMAINAGSGTLASRTMAGGVAGNTDKLAYNLYTDAGATQVWGDGSASTSTVGLTGTGADQTSTVYGKLALNQYVKPDTYTDNLTVTLAY